MSSLEWKPNKPKFLLDENVKKKLLLFLKSEEYDVVFKPKGLSNGKLAEFSKSEERVFVTNDDDFLGFTKEKLFSLVWIRVSQNNEELLIDSFSKLLRELDSKDFKGKLIVLYEEKFEVTQLTEA
ncbi:MAG: DUF5615 family PIN-like protein [Nanoarchaeota archaeon]|nr:DUF5615 family PIN-like protein [Nanoarchaeota archaeon]